MNNNDLIKPIDGYYLKNDTSLLAPPYDVLSLKDVNHYALKNPHNLVHITRAESCLKKEALDDSALNYASQKLNELLQNKNLISPFKKPSIVIYQIKKNNHCQTGFMSLAHVNGIKVHEQTREKKVNEQIQLTRHLKTQISPILLCYKNHDELTQKLEALCQKATPSLSFKDENHFQHTLFIPNENEQKNLLTLTNRLNHLYIADGHHRHQTIKTLHENDGFSPYVLSVSFAKEQLNILGYHRIITCSDQKEKQLLLEKLQQKFNLKKLNSPFLPENLNSIGLCVDGHWQSFEIENKNSTTGAALLDDEVLLPIFNVKDIRKDKRLSFVGGEKALEDISQETLKNPLAIGFTLAPVDADVLLTIADNDEIMPPKSTWFEPKLLDGFCLTYCNLR